MFRSPRIPGVLLLTITLYGMTGCVPTIKVAPSDKPITINLNVKIEHEIRVKVDKELDELIGKESGIF